MGITKMNNPMVSVIIVNYNGKNHLEKCLESLMKVDYEKYEVILIDNNSTDDSIEFVKNVYPSVIIIKLEKNYGFAEPNNIGAKNAKGELLLFLNNDTVVNPNFIQELIKVINLDSKIAICQSLLLKPNGEVESSGDFIDILGRAFMSKEKVTEVKEILSARGACMLVRKNIFWELGGFDKNFFASFEDIDLSWRAWIWGYKIVLVPNSIVYHTGGQTVELLRSEIKFHGAKNILIICLANFETPLSRVMKLFFAYLMKKSLGISVVTKFESSIPLPSLGTVLRGLMWVLKNLKYVSEKRKKVNSRRARSTEELEEKGLIRKL